MLVHSVFYRQCTWCDISCGPDVKPSILFSKSDSRPSLCGCHRTVCSHKVRPPSLNLLTLSDQRGRSVKKERLFLSPTCAGLSPGLSNLIVTWSASTKMILSTAKGNNTSRKRILYPQIMRCFSVCWWSQRGHLYCTNSYWKPYAWAMWCMVSWQPNTNSRG